MSYYKLGLSLDQPLALPERFQHLVRGAQDFHTGAQRFYDAEIVGAASGTPLGTLADGIVAIVLDAVHVLLMVGGFIFMARAIFA